MLPTPRLVRCALPLLAVALLAVLLEPARGPLAWAWLAGLCALLAATALEAARLRERRAALEARVQLGEELLLGEPAAAQVELAGLPGTQVEACLWADAALGADPQPARATLDAGGQARLELALRPGQRGLHALQALALRVSGPLGLLRAARMAPARQEVRVLPSTRRVRQAALAVLGSRSLERGLSVERVLGDGSEFHALREWTQGMDPRAISWPASARHRSLLGLERRAERSQRLVLALDTGHAMAGTVQGLCRLDHAVEAALLLAWAGLKAGDRVGLHAFDERPHAWLAPAASLARYEALRRALAGLAARPVESSLALGLADLAARLERRALVVLFTEFSDVVAGELVLEPLQRLCRRHVVLFATLADAGLAARAAAAPRTLQGLHAAVAAQDLLRERAVLLERIARMGVQVVEAPAAGLAPAVLRRWLHVKRRELVG
ncbi:MAG: DUF58 domain-containing protein [Planctomycetia bacterium]